MPPATPVAIPPPAPQADLSPVKEPATFVGWARLSDTERTLATAFGYVGMPAPNAEMLGDLLEMRELSAVVDLTQPLEAAVFLMGERTPTPRVLVSVPLRSLADAKKKLAALTIADKDGILTLDMDRHADAEDESRLEASSKLCMLGPAVGKRAGIAGAPRMVCGRRDALEMHAGYMTRTLPTLSAPSPLYLELRPRPLRAPARDLAKMAQALRFLLDTPALMGLVELATAAADDGAQLVGDLDAITVEGNLAAEGAQAKINLRFASAQSTLAKLMVSHPERAGTPPAGFALVPSAPSAAMYNHGVDLTPLDPALARLLAQLGELAQQEGFPQVDRVRVEGLITRAKTLIAPAASSSAGLDPATDQLLSTWSTSKGTPAAINKARLELVAALEGWKETHAAVAPSEVINLIEETRVVFNSPTLRKWLLGKLKGGADPGVEKRAAQTLAAAVLKVKVSNAPASAKLPAGTQIVQMTTPRIDQIVASDHTKPSAPKVELQNEWLYLTPEGTGTLIVRAASSAFAATKMKEALAKAGEGHEAVKKLASTKASGGLFLTPRLLAAAFAQKTLNSPDAQPSSRVVRRFRAASDEPVFFTWTALPQAENAAAGALELSLEVPKKTLLSLIPLARQL